MALFSVPMIPRDGTITLADSTGSPITLTVAYEDGDFAWDPMEEGYMDTVIIKDRGVPYAMRKTEMQELTFTFTAHATDFTDATEKCLIDAVLKKGAYSAGVSALGSSADVWALKVTFTAEQTSYGGSADSAVAFLKCRLSIGFAEGVPAKFTLKGKIFITGDSDITWT